MPGQHQILGKVQGKSDITSLWAMISCVLLLAHSLRYIGINLLGVAGGKGIKKNNDAYIDDVDTWAGSMCCGRNAVDNTMRHLAMGAQSWLDLQDVVAASTAFHKCIVQTVVYVVVKGSLEITYNYNYSYDMELSDIKGAWTKIKYLKADQPNIRLGFHLAPDGNMDKVGDMCKAALSISMHLSQTEAHTMLTGCLKTQTTYVI